MLVNNSLKRPHLNDDEKEMFAMKRMAIANALAPYLSQETLEEALIIWEHKYAHQPTFALQRFISEFCDNNVAGQRSKILQALFLALNNSPNGSAATESEKIATPPVLTQGATSCFELLLTNILSSLTHDHQQKVRLLTTQQIETLKLNTIITRDLKAFFSQGYTLPSSFYMEVKAMRRCLNLVYVALCDVLGPVKADAVLHNAINLTEQQSSGSFSVRELL